ncbi:MAG: hypothetical protein H6709_11820 [Kofleriaceae bacterium]|nr:hypothetical protein [Kofleriaceae bacterium]MCB9572764.1 hypothetical protein [Kofleriaceae bacterium]
MDLAAVASAATATAAAAALAVACGAPSPATSTTASSSPAVANQAAATAPSAATPAEVQALSRELAAIVDATPVAWGTADLDDVPGRDAFAVLMGNQFDFVYYLIDVGDQRRYLLKLELDGRTQVWAPGRADPPEVPSWTDSDDTAIDHVQTHRGGYEQVRLAIAGGQVVELFYEELNDGRDGDEPEGQRWAATAAACAGACPVVRPEQPWFVHDVHGPAADLDALVGDVPPPPMPAAAAP